MKIVNIVATVSLPNPIDLKTLHNNLKGSNFRPKVHWLQYRLPPDNTYVAFYGSGKFLMTVKSMDKLQPYSQKVLKILKDCGINVSESKMVIHNLVISHTIELTASLEKLIFSLDSKKFSYEPEQFPALNYKDWGVSFLLFSSGKVIITGAKNEKQAQDAMIQFQELINNG